jgi:acetyl esterase/lipase
MPILVNPKFLLVSLALSFFAPVLFAQNNFYPPEANIVADFHKLLERPPVKPWPSFKVTVTDSVIIEHGYIYSEINEKVPMLIYKPISATAKPLRVVIFLHGTGGSKDGGEITNVLYRLSKRGIMGVAIDARFHGERVAGRAHGSNEYVAAITKAWRNTDPDKQTHPFFFDTVYDLWRVTDYLITRPDVAGGRIGMGGISMGGIETWLAAAADKRIKVVVPDIAVQSFAWSLANSHWQGRANTIKGAHLQAAKDLGDAELNNKNVKALWDKLIPGITFEYDCPSMLRLIAPRPMLILSTENDPNNPLPGAKIAYGTAEQAYRTDNATEKLKMDVTPKLGHTSTPEHLKMTLDWFEKWL